MRNKRFIAAIMAVVLCTGVLSGCGGGGNAEEIAAKEKYGTTYGAGTRGTDSNDNTILYLNKNGEWMLSKAEEGAKGVVVHNNAGYDFTYVDGRKEYPNYVPGLTESEESFVWFTADGKAIYFFTAADLLYNSLVLYKIDRTKLNNDYSNAAECVSLIAENISYTVNNQMVENGMLFCKADGELCYYDGEKLITLADGVMSGHPLNEPPYTGTAGFQVVNDGKIVLYVEVDWDKVSLYAVPLDGSSPATLLAKDGKGYYWDPVLEQVFIYGENLRAVTLDGEETVIAEECKDCVEPYGGIYYTTDYQDLYYYDGQETELIAPNTGYSGSYCNAKNRIAVFKNEGAYPYEWYLKIGDEQEVRIPKLDGFYVTDCYGLLNDDEIILQVNDNLTDDESLVSLKLKNTAVTEVEYIDDNVKFARNKNGKELYYYSNRYEDTKDKFVYDLCKYADGKTTTILQDIIYSYTCVYPDGTVITAKNGKLEKTVNGKEKSIADGVEYFLKLLSGNVLYISDDVLYYYDDDKQIKLDDAVEFVFAANGEYTVGMNGYNEHHYKW